MENQFYISYMKKHIIEMQFLLAQNQATIYGMALLIIGNMHTQAFQTLYD